MHKFQSHKKLLKSAPDVSCEHAWSVVFVANGVKIRRDTGVKNGKKLVKPTLNVSKLPRIQSDLKIHMEYFPKNLSENVNRFNAVKKAYLRSTELLEKNSDNAKKTRNQSFKVKICSV